MKFSIYKKGQGYYTRLCSGFAGVLLAALGCYQLRESLGSWLGTDIANATKTILMAAIPIIVLVALGLFIFSLVNKPKTADFMIETEGEMKKVNWPARKEIISSTKVVIITVIAMAIMLGVIDFVFHWVFQKMGIVAG